MIKVNIQLPDWADGKDIFVFAGSEEVARKVPDQDSWWVKVGRCEQCGKCCSDLGSGEGHPFAVINGVCEHLKDGGCGLRGYRPFACCIGGGSSDCPVTFEEYRG